ncbi:hypothetical protein M3Y98_00941200 [Aphelenchoides besseyi]|nr:hypothetical protein M3Y98_00941200 [Aphelenchoides besseyi]KAI6194338.1 hypothetical protein M3Y96_01114400 [Aphelenchoides besseyi]
MWTRTTLVVGLFLAVVAASHHKHHHRQPIIQLNGAEEFLGSLREDERIVNISPHLSVYPDTGPICKYELTSTSNDENPFEVEILDKHQGTAIIRVRDNAKPIDCSHNEYHLRVVAIRCADDTSRSEPASLKISVKDTNNHAPEFDAPWYSFDVVEGKMESNIARLYTSDKDCGHPYGKICRYEITNALEGFPFRIDDQGVLSTTRPLNRSDAESHILTVVAYDCGMQRSKSTLVTINVRRNCNEGLRGTPAANTPIQYAPGTGSRILMPEAELIVCPTEKKCEVKKATSELKLDVERDGEQDIASTQKCGMNLKTLDLLPRPKSTINERNVVIGRDGKEKELLVDSVEKPAKDVAPTTTIKSPTIEDDGEEEDDGEDENDEDLSVEERTPAPVERYVFDGKSNAVIVPSATIKQVIPERFTLAFSMKHAAGTKDEQSQKQNILCETDDFNMNRHHMAVYIRHCKLEVLLRREAAHASAEFRAAEWRWETPEVCDDQWHSYSILFNDLDNVQLYIDGRKFTTTERNPEILDDWPLHETKELKTRLVVGGCWHGRSSSMVQFFKGHLSSMYLLPGEVESEAAIECLHQPKERLRFDAMEQLVPGESATFAEDQTRLTLVANTVEDLSLLLQRVEYVNTNAAAQPGKRRLTVSSSVQCGENEKHSLGVYETNVQVKKAEDPILSISGQNLINTDRHSLKVGTAMLPDLQITVTQSVGGKEIDVTEKYNLDNCKLHLRPSRDMDLEYFSSPAALIASLNVDFEHDAQGILLKGEETIHGYLEVLSKIHYFNTRPESYNKRMYTLQCTMNQGKIYSNEFFVTMNIDSEMNEAIEKLERASQKLDIDENDLIKRFEPSAFDQLGANRLQNILEMDLPRPKALLSHHGYEMGQQGAFAGGAIAVIVVICVGFLLVLLVVGVLKMRDSPIPRRRRQRKNPAMQEGMEWDDSGMNITVNPLEDVEKQEQTAVASYSESEDESSDGESYHDEDEFTDEESETTPLPHTSNGRNGLEWDDSTLAASNVARTYRV